MDSDISARVKAFTAESHQGNASIMIPFVAVRVLVVGFVASWPDIMVKMKNINRLSFNCAECGDLDRDMVLHTYDPRKTPITDRLRFCPSCQHTTEVRVSFDSNKRVSPYLDVDRQIAKEMGVTLDEPWD